MAVRVARDPCSTRHASPFLPRHILVAWRRGVLRVGFSPEIFDPFLQLLGVHGELVEAAKLAEPVTDDPDDDKFFACALASGVRVIISGLKIFTKLLVGVRWRWLGPLISVSGS